MQIVPYDPSGYWLLHEGMIAFSDVQQNGINIDTKYCKKTFKQLGQEIREVKSKLESHEEIKKWRKKYKANFSLDSDDQLSDILFNVFGYESTKETKGGGQSVDQEVLSNLNIPVTNDLLRYRKLDKLRNGFLKNLMKETCDGMLYPFLNLHTVVTYRSSSNNVNIQNQPSRDEEGKRIIRQAFRPSKDCYLVAADYGGVEVKGSSWYHEDPIMLKYLRNPKSADMHADFCKQIYKLDNYDGDNKGDKKLRKGTKNGFTFPQFYGDYYGNNAVALWGWAGLKGEKIKAKDGVTISNGKTIGKHLIDNGIKNFKQFVFHIKKIEQHMWKNKFYVYKQWRDDQWEHYLENGYVSLLTGFICQGLMGRNEVINYPIQGCCFHCLLWSLIQLNKLMQKERMRSKLIFQVHDEIVADVCKDEYDEYMDMLKQVMIADLKKHFDFIITPLELEVERSELNGNWYKMDKVLEYIE